MVRRWGYDNNTFATYTVVTNAWDVLVKLALPMIALPWLALLYHDRAMSEALQGRGSPASRSSSRASRRRSRRAASPRSRRSSAASSGAGSRA